MRWSREQDPRLRRIFFFGIVVSLSVFPLLISHAHHGFASHYDVDQYVTIKGTVTRFEFVNPHAFVYLETTDESGNTINRWCETQSRTQLSRKGIEQSSFAVGDVVTIEGFQSRRDPLGCELGKAYLADGSVLFTRAPDGHAQYRAPEVEIDQSVLGTWHRKAFPGAGSNPPPGENLTAAGEAAYAAYNHETDYPTLHCSSVSPVQSWQQPGLPTLVSREGDKIIIRHEFMDGRREVHLDLDEHPAAIEPSVMGHSIGRFEGNDLVIETTGFLAGSVANALLHSADFEMTERLSVDPESGDLEITWQATDPTYYTQPLAGNRIMVRTEMEIDSFECIPGSGHHPDPG